MNEQQIIGVLEARVVELQQSEQRYRSIAYWLAGYFHLHAVDSGLPVKMPGDLVQWAADQTSPSQL